MSEDPVEPTVDDSARYDTTKHPAVPSSGPPDTGSGDPAHFAAVTGTPDTGSGDPGHFASIAGTADAASDDQARFASPDFSHGTHTEVFTTQQFDLESVNVDTATDEQSSDEPPADDRAAEPDPSKSETDTGALGGPDETSADKDIAPPAPDAGKQSQQRPETATSDGRPPSLGVTIGLLVTLLVSSLVMLVAGLSLFARLDAASAVTWTSIAIGGSLLIWHLWALISGSGRKTAMISRWPWIDLVVIAAFGVATGFALFDTLTGVRSAPRIAMLAAGLVGLIAALVAFVRDTDLRDRGLLTVSRPKPAAPPAPQPETEPEPDEVFFDPTGESDELRPRGTWPQPRRGTAADASLWDEPEFEEPEPPRRAARRAAE